MSRQATSSVAASAASGALAPNDPRHGTANGYANCGCRCDACRTAATAYARERGIGAYRRVQCACGNAKEPKSLRCRACMIAEVEAPHGTATRYSRGCRCDGCRAAGSAARRAFRERLKVPCERCGSPTSPADCVDRVGGLSARALCNRCSPRFRTTAAGRPPQKDPEPAPEPQAGVLP